VSNLVRDETREEPKRFFECRAGARGDHIYEKRISTEQSFLDLSGWKMGILMGLSCGGPANKNGNLN
jgi:hypothetical protein